MAFTALPVQQQLFDVARDGRYHIIGFGGGIRGTKTWGSLSVLVTLCRLFPRSRWAIVRTDLPRLRRNTIPSFDKLRELLGGFVGPLNQSTWTYPCANGSELIVFPESLDVDPDWSRWKGLEVNGFLLEEADELAEGSLHKAVERAGAWIVPDGGQQPPPYVFCTFNPCANWPKRVFYEPWQHGTLTAPYAFIPATAADNPYIDERQREAWKNLPESEYKRFVEGDWNVLTGRYYDGLDGRVHLVPRDTLPDPVPDWYEAWGSFDWGYAHWAVFGLWVKDRDGIPYLWDSLWLRKHQDVDQARSIVAWTQGHGLQRALGEVYAGRDCFHRIHARSATGESTADVFAAHGISLVPADDDRINSGRAVRRALTVREGRAGVYLVDTAANRRVFDQLAETMPDEKDVNKPAKVDADAEGRGGDDGENMFRFGLATRVPAATAPQPATFPARWTPDRDDEAFRPRTERTPQTYVGGYAVDFI